MTMQVLVHIPDSLAERFKRAVPSRQRSAFVAGLLEQAFPVEDDPLYLAALEVEKDAALSAEMKEWRDGLIADGIRGLEEMEEGADAAR
jgi:hypothetical protein